MLKCGDKVYTQIIIYCSIKKLLPIIKEDIGSDTVIYSDVCRNNNRLNNYGNKKHCRVKYDYNVFTDGPNHINGIENFWELRKVKPTKFLFYKNIHSIYSLKNVNSGTTTKTKTYI